MQFFFPHTGSGILNTELLVNPENQDFLCIQHIIGILWDLAGGDMYNNEFASHTAGSMLCFNEDPA